MTNSDLKRMAKEKLKGNWGIALAAILVASIITSAASAVFGIVELVVIGPLAVGLACIFLGIVRGRKAQFEDLFAGFNNFFNTFITGLLVTLFTFLWSLLFVIPGIIKSYSYAMTYYIQYDHPEMSETDAITASRQMMNGHKWDLFMLDLSFFGWYLLVVLTFGLLSLYVIPYHLAARAAFYENLVAAESGAGSASTDTMGTFSVDPDISASRTDPSDESL